MRKMDEAVVRLLEESVAWRLIGLSMERPLPGWKDAIRKIASERDVESDIESLAERATSEGSETLHLATFGTGGTVSPREVSYRRMGDPGRILAELETMYQTFAFMPDSEEPPDHVAVEAGFVGFLRLKEAYAVVNGEHESAALVRQAADLFIVDHLVYLVAGISERLHGGYLSEAAECLRRRVGPIPKEIATSVALPDVAGEFDACLAGCSFEEG